MEAVCVDDWLRQELRDLRSDVRDLRNENQETRNLLSRIAERVRVVEVYNENEVTRNRALPGWVISAAGVLVALLSVIISLRVAGIL